MLTRTIFPLFITMLVVALIADNSVSFVEAHVTATATASGAELAGFADRFGLK